MGKGGCIESLDRARARITYSNRRVGGGSRRTRGSIDISCGELAARKKN